MSESYQDETRGTKIVMSKVAQKRLAQKPYTSGFVAHLHEFLSGIGADWAYVSKSGPSGVEVTVVWHS